MVFYVDLDCFKFVNDMFGYDVGDCLFKFVVSMLCWLIGECDFVVWIGGDEFVIF